MSFEDLQNSNKRASGSAPPPSQAVAAAIFQINTAIAGFRRLVDAIGTSKDTPDHRLNLNNSRQRILNLVKETSAKLKSLSEFNRGTGIDPSKKIEDAKLARDFQIVLQEFQKAQQLASEKESAFTPSAPPSTAAAMPSSDQYTAASAEQENHPFLMEQKRQEVVLLGNEISFNEAVIEERDQGIKEIQDQIGEASEIFKDLAVLVNDQGLVIDDVHSNIDASSAATTQARVQLSKASKSGKAKSSWCWWVFALVVLALVILLLVLIL